MKVAFGRFDDLTFYLRNELLPKAHQSKTTNFGSLLFNHKSNDKGKKQIKLVSHFIGPVVYLIVCLFWVCALAPKNERNGKNEQNSSRDFNSEAHSIPKNTVSIELKSKVRRKRRLL